MYKIASHLRTLPVDFVLFTTTFCGFISLDADTGFGMFRNFLAKIILFSHTFLQNPLRAAAKISRSFWIPLQNFTFFVAWQMQNCYNFS